MNMDDYQREVLRTAGDPTPDGWLFEKLRRRYPDGFSVEASRNRGES